MMYRLTIAVIAGLLLAACNGGGDTGAAAGEDGAPSGEVLPSSVSDAMIPLDQLRSQAPSAKGTGDDGDGTAEAQEEADSQAATGAPDAAGSDDVEEDGAEATE